MDARRAVLPATIGVAVTLAASGLATGRSIFGFESPFWDIGLLPILAALVIGLTQLGGPRRRFMVGLEICGALAVAAYIASCSHPARWSVVSALLPFQTGFWLAPEMRASWRTLNPFGILVDAVVLAAMPLLLALVGGALASIRINVRRAMIAVAVIAIPLGTRTVYLRRVRHYDSMGQYHRSQVISVLLGSAGQDGRIRFAPTGVDRSGKAVAEAQNRKDAWHEAMAQRYWQAARYPWVKVIEDPLPKPTR